MNKTLTFYSVNRPGSRMGFGHYERLLFNHYFSRYHDYSKTAEVVYSGRGQLSSDLSMDIEQSVLGYSVQRYSKLPWWLASSLFNNSLRRTGVVHLLSMDFPIKNNKPTMITVHDIPPYHFTDEGSLPIWSRELLKSVSLIQVPSEFSKNELIDYLDVDADKIHVVPNGLESDVFNTNVEVFSREEKVRIGLPDQYILFAAGASQRKNLPNLLSAWTKVQDKYPEIHLILAGPQRVNEILATYPNCRAKYIGYLNRQDLPRAMRSSRFVVCPSIYEGFGLPALESLACGAPVLTTALGAIPEVVGNAALKCPTGDVDDLVSGIEMMIDDQKLVDRLTTEGPLQASKFSWTDHVQKVHVLHSRLESE